MVTNLIESILCFNFYKIATSKFILKDQSLISATNSYFAIVDKQFSGCARISILGLITILSLIGILPEITLLTIVFVGLIYEVGLIVNRISSVVFEELLKKIKLIPFENDYSKYDAARNDNPFLNTLSREYALSRNSFTLFFLLMIISIIKLNLMLIIITLVIELLFFFSMRKHAGKIVTIVHRHVSEGGKQL